jgi:putative acetyltransferase
MVIRPERLADIPAIRAVNREAFETPTEAQLVDALREQAQPIVSLVAEDVDTIVGHILFSPAALLAHPELRIMGLAPMAVVPARQRQGIGSALVREGLDRCREMGIAVVIVVGHAGYYPKFGFTPASRLGVTCEYEVPDNAFMLVELKEGVLREKSGTVRYHEAFRTV